MSEFKWTDDLLKEFISQNSAALKPFWLKRMEEFKASKQPKPEYEILEGIHPNSTKHHKWLTRECEQEGCKIHSVRRLSDGEVFAVGDGVDIKPKGYGWTKTMEPITIEKFKVNDDGMMAYFGSLGYNLNRLVRKTQVPVPVLLTPSEIEKLQAINLLFYSSHIAIQKARIVNLLGMLLAPNAPT